MVLYQQKAFVKVKAYQFSVPRAERFLIVSAPELQPLDSDKMQGV